MLYELKNVQQESENDYRRWFTDDYFDLIVWYDSSKQIKGFQLCYDKLNNEHALTWMKDMGYTHNRIDSGPTDYHSMQTPILVQDGICPKDMISNKFQERCLKLEKDIREIVIDKLRNHID